MKRITIEMTAGTPLRWAWRVEVFPVAGQWGVVDQGVADTAAEAWEAASAQTPVRFNTLT